MKFPFLNDPQTGAPDEFVTIAMIVTLAVVFRFLVDGSSWTILGHVFTFTKLDPGVYIALLGPALATHGYQSVSKGNKNAE